MRHLSLLLLLAACNASGPSFNESLLSVGDDSTVVVYRNNKFLGAAGYFEIDVNGIPACKLHNQGFYVIKSNGNINISSSIWNQPGTSLIQLKTVPGQAYFVRMEMDSDKQVAGGLGGIGGQMIAENVSNNAGPFVFTQVDRSTAIKELNTLKQDCI